jgi:hypothetical protein
MPRREAGERVQTGDYPAAGHTLPPAVPLVNHCRHRVVPIVSGPLHRVRGPVPVKNTSSGYRSLLLIFLLLTVAKLLPGRCTVKDNQKRRSGV